ncbi:hypothetical protein Bca4012_011602 [Brassica carinata]
MGHTQVHRRLVIRPERLWLVILGYRQWRRNPRVMGFGKDVVLPYAAVVSWTHASETSELKISCRLLL